MVSRMEALIPLWWSSKGVLRAPWAAKMDEGMEASWKALASKGR